MSGLWKRKGWRIRLAHSNRKVWSSDPGIWSTQPLYYVPPGSSKWWPRWDGNRSHTLWSGHLSSSAVLAQRLSLGDERQKLALGDECLIKQKGSPRRWKTCSPGYSNFPFLSRAIRDSMFETVAATLQFTMAATKNMILDVVHSTEYSESVLATFRELFSGPAWSAAKFSGPARRPARVHLKFPNLSRKEQNSHKFCHRQYAVELRLCRRTESAPFWFYVFWTYRLNWIYAVLILRILNLYTCRTGSLLFFRVFCSVSDPNNICTFHWKNTGVQILIQTIWWRAFQFQTEIMIRSCNHRKKANIGKPW